jgi:hypothetical protein
MQGFMENGGKERGGGVGRGHGELGRLSSGQLPILRNHSAQNLEIWGISAKKFAFPLAKQTRRESEGEKLPGRDSNLRPIG